MLSFCIRFANKSQNGIEHFEMCAFFKDNLLYSGIINSNPVNAIYDVLQMRYNPQSVFPLVAYPCIVYVEFDNTNSGPSIVEEIRRCFPGMKVEPYYTQGNLTKELRKRANPKTSELLQFGHWNAKNANRSFL